MIYTKGGHPPVAIFGKGDVLMDICEEPIYIGRGMYQMAFRFRNVKTETGGVDPDSQSGDRPGSQWYSPPDLILAFDNPESMGILVDALEAGQKTFVEYLQQNNIEEEQSDGDSDQS